MSRFLFDRVAEGDAVRLDPQMQAQIDLAAARDVEAGAHPVQHRQDLAGGIGLDRVEHPGQRQIVPQQLVGVGHDFEIDYQAWRRRMLFGEEAHGLFGDAASAHGALAARPDGRNVRRAGRARGFHRRGQRARLRNAQERSSTSLQYGNAATATADARVEPIPDEILGDVRPGRCGPAQESNHIDLPLGTGPR